MNDSTLAWVNHRLQRNNVTVLFLWTIQWFPLRQEIPHGHDREGRCPYVIWIRSFSESHGASSGKYYIDQVSEPHLVRRPATCTSFHADNPVRNDMNQQKHLLIKFIKQYNNLITLSSQQSLQNYNTQWAVTPYLARSSSPSSVDTKSSFSRIFK